MNRLEGRELTIKFKDIVISYDDLGLSDTPVIFIHGFPFDRSTWQPQMDFLSKTHRTIAYDIRGFGKSDSGNEKFSIGLFASDLIDFMDALNIKKAIVCGLSMGGYILMNAVHYHPDRFAAMILCDTQCIADSAEAKAGRMKAIKSIEEGGLNEFTEGFIKKLFCNQTLANKPDLVQNVTNIILSTKTDSITSTLNALAERDEMCTKMVVTSIPAMILCGDADVITPPNQSELLQKNLAGSTIHLIKDAGHLSNLEQPTDFNDQLLRFVSGLTK